MNEITKSADTGRNPLEAAGGWRAAMNRNPAIPDSSPATSATYRAPRDKRHLLHRPGDTHHLSHRLKPKTLYFRIRGERDGI